MDVHPLSPRISSFLFCTLNYFLWRLSRHLRLCTLRTHGYHGYLHGFPLLRPLDWTERSIGDAGWSWRRRWSGQRVLRCLNAHSISFLRRKLPIWFLGSLIRLLRHLVELIRLVLDSLLRVDRAQIDGYRFQPLRLRCLLTLWFIEGATLTRFLDLYALFVFEGGITRGLVVLRHSDIHDGLLLTGLNLICHYYRLLQIHRMIQFLSGLQEGVVCWREAIQCFALSQVWSCFAADADFNLRFRWAIELTQPSLPLIRRRADRTLWLL